MKYAATERWRLHAVMSLETKTSATFRDVCAYEEACKRGRSLIARATMKMEIFMKTQSISLALLIALPAWTNCASAWPSAHPADAAHGRISNSLGTYDAYFWWEGSDLYLEAVPAGGSPYVCSGNFIYVQDGIQGGTDLHDSKNRSFCDDLVIATVLKVTASGDVLDSAIDTTMVDSDGNEGGPVYIQIPKSDGATSSPGVPAVSLSSLAAKKIVCKSKGSKVNATQTSDNRFSCNGLVIGKNRNVTITINGKLPQ